MVGWAGNALRSVGERAFQRRLRPRKTAAWEGSKTQSAQEVLLTCAWVPICSDDAQDEGWFSEMLEAEEQIVLNPKDVGRLLMKLYESGFRFLPAKSGPKGYKTRFWRKPEGESPDISLGDLDSLDDDLRGLLGDDG
jgi:hypothetical protein